MLGYEALGTSGCRQGGLSPLHLSPGGLGSTSPPLFLSLQGAELRSGDIKGRVLSGECGPHEDTGTRRGDTRGSRWALSEIGATFSLIFLEAKVVKKNLPGGWKSSKAAQKKRRVCVLGGGTQSKRKTRDKSG